MSSGLNQILVAAEALFAMHGYSAVSMAQVAKAAKVSKSNIYHHFKSKDDLYRSVVRHACQETLEMTRNLSTSTGDVVGQLANFSHGHFKHLHEKSALTRLVLRELLDGDNEHGRMLAQDVFCEHFLQLKSYIQQGQREQCIREDIDADHIAVALVSLNLMLFQLWPVLQHLPDATFQKQEDSQQQMLNLLLRGLQCASD